MAETRFEPGEKQRKFWFRGVKGRCPLGRKKNQVSGTEKKKKKKKKGDGRGPAGRGKKEQRFQDWDSPPGRPETPAKGGKRLRPRLIRTEAPFASKKLATDHIFGNKKRRGRSRTSTRFLFREKKPWARPRFLKGGEKEWRLWTGTAVFRKKKRGECSEASRCLPRRGKRGKPSFTGDAMGKDPYFSSEGKKLEGPHCLFYD